MKEGNIVRLKLSRQRPHSLGLFKLRPHRLRLSRQMPYRIRSNRLGWVKIHWLRFFRLSLYGSETWGGVKVKLYTLLSVVKQIFSQLTTLPDITDHFGVQSPELAFAFLVTRLRIVSLGDSTNLIIAGTFFASTYHFSVIELGDLNIIEGH